MIVALSVMSALFYLMSFISYCIIYDKLYMIPYVFIYSGIFCTLFLLVWCKLNDYYFDEEDIIALKRRKK